MSKILKSYFYWTYPRGSFHYDILVTLCLAFIFITPHFVDFGDKPPSVAGPRYPIQVIGDSSHGLIVTVQAAEVDLDLHTTASNQVVRRALRKAIEPVTGDAVFIERWETVTDTQGNPAWKVWAHK
jgi:hypothetical protein